MTDIATAFLSSRPHDCSAARSWFYRFCLNLVTACLLLEMLPAGIARTSSVLHAQEAQSDIRSLNRLFGPELSNNALEIRHRSREMPAEERYQYLSQKVLPGETNEIRIAIDFIPTNPSPPVLEKYGPVELPLLKTARKRRIPSGGALVSPAIDLVELAGELGKLDELKAAVNRRAPVEPEQIKARSAILILIEAAKGEFDQYAGRVTEFMTLVRESPITDIERAPEMVIAWQGAMQTETRSAVRDLLLFVQEQTKSSNYRHRESVKRHLSSLSHLLDEELVQQRSASSDQRNDEAFEHWHIVSQDKAETRGGGYPNAAWAMTPARARHVSSHGADYLYYAIPLRGDFEIDGELTTFGYREIRLAIGTIWAGPVYSRKTIDWGTFRGARPGIVVDPPLADPGDQMRVRDVVRNGRRTVFINGRSVFDFVQGPTSEPWVAATTPWFTSGEMRNVRITGHPEIPEEIDLIANSDLPGWLSYYDETVGSEGSTWHLGRPSGLDVNEPSNPPPESSHAVLIGRKNGSLTGQFQESLLRYHRPMVEDGTIEYEFFSNEDDLGVFPALDRCCFLFDSKGAGIHWLTDGKFDRTGLAPTNFFPSQDVPSIPLIANGWNQLQLTLEGDIVEIVLNGTSILTRKLEPENLRTFGLFHYSDQTEARVRNLRWRGEWPKKLPPIAEQELADDSLERELASGPELQTVFEHDFSTGLPKDTIWAAGDNWQELTEQRPGGLLMRRTAEEGYHKTALSLPLGLEGDFDVTWEFADFQSSPSSGGNGNVHLLVLLDDDNATECRLYRKLEVSDSGRHRQLLQPSIFYTKPDGKTHYGFPLNMTDESTGGKLRLVRRGTRLDFLYAQGDSDFFRPVYRATVPEVPVKFAGIQGIIETHQKGETAAVWKRVTVRAESGSEIARDDITVLELDEGRNQLAQSRAFDFDEDATPDGLAIWGEPKAITREKGGWIVRQPGSDRWQATRLKPQIGLQGDFDVTVELDVLKLDQSKPRSESTIYFNASFETPRPLGIEIKYSKSMRSPRSLEIQMNTRGRDRGLRYDELKHQPADEVTQLRLARRGSTAYLIARRSADDKPEIFGSIEVGTADVPLGSLTIGVHTGGAGQETIVRFKSIKIHAEQFK